MKMKEKIIGSAAILVLSIVFLVFGYLSRDNREEDYQVFTQSEEVTNEVDKTKLKEEVGGEVKKEGAVESIVKSTIVVDIKGAVKNPREYELEAGTRVRDLIEIAGGLSEGADEERIYFSKLLEDEQCIKIYKIGEVTDVEFEEEITNNSNNSENESATKKKININSATVEELKTLSGIGEVRAKSIVDYRESNGKFNSIDDLANITGIGLKTIEKLRDMVDIK